MDDKTQQYLIKRRLALLKDLQTFIAEQETIKAGGDAKLHYDVQTLDDLIMTHEAREVELGLMWTCLVIEDEHRAMDERDKARATEARQRNAMREMIEENERARAEDTDERGDTTELARAHNEAADKAARERDQEEDYNPEDYPTPDDTPSLETQGTVFDPNL